MICKICQGVLRTQSPDGDKGHVTHHISFASLTISARVGCQLCNAFWTQFSDSDQAKLLNTDQPVSNAAITRLRWAEAWCSRSRSMLGHEAERSSRRILGAAMQQARIATRLHLLPAQPGSGVDEDGTIAIGISACRDIDHILFARPVFFQLYLIEQNPLESKGVLRRRSHHS